MDLSRREFLGYTAGAIGAVGLPLPHAARTEPPLPISVDNESYGSESWRGYIAALPRELSPLDRCSLLIVPRLMRLSPFRARQMIAVLARGGTVVIESGAGFADAATFRHHARALREGLQLQVAAPVDRWADQSTPRTPYIEFTWPRRASIRDFSRFVPPAEQPGEIIAWARDVPVALKRPVASGTLIYLGSPVGPSLWTGDAEARRWVYAVALAA